MGRLLLLLASSFGLLCATGAALAQPVAEPAQPAIPGDAICDAGGDEVRLLGEIEKAHCRRVWQKRIDEMRQRSQAHVRQVIEDNRQRRASAVTLPTPPVTVESFIAEGQLQYGDVVVTDRGPRVFIGRPESPVGPESFVPVDSPLSPHRARATQFDGALPGRRPVLPAEAPQKKTGRKESQP